MDELGTRGQLREIGRDECLELVASKAVGHIGYCSIRGAVILPVNHAVIGGEIVVRIAPSGQTARFLSDNGPGVDMTFQADDFDERSETGWSVLVTGTVQSVEQESLDQVNDRPVPWVAGGIWDYVRIHPNRVTGRRLVST